MPSKTNNSMNQLNILVAAAIAAWAVTFSLVFGPFVFGYLAMHAATTGLFLLAIHRSDRARERQFSMPSSRPAAIVAANRTKSERVARTQPAA